MSKTGLSFTFSVVPCAILFLALCCSFALFEETTLELKDENGPASSKQTSYWTEDEDEDEEVKASEMNDAGGPNLEFEDDNDDEMEGTPQVN